MARRKKGRNINGWLIVDKPAGVTSSAVVNKLRWLLNARKAGHAGTLDPAATGLLAVAFGEATKTIPFITDSLKRYDFTVNWGAATNTDDAEGEVIATSAQRPSSEAIEESLEGFRGNILQVPPQVSAVKIDGKRAYKRVREGESVEIEPRPLFVAALDVQSHALPDQSMFSMTCGKGGYVRAIARDLGADLGCLGHVNNLRRVSSGPFSLDDAIPYQDILESERDYPLAEHLMPLEAALIDIPLCVCAHSDFAALTNGNTVQVRETNAAEGDSVWAGIDGQAYALGTYRAGVFDPTRVLVRDD